MDQFFIQFDLTTIVDECLIAPINSDLVIERELEAFSTPNMLYSFDEIIELFEIYTIRQDTIDQGVCAEVQNCLSDKSCAKIQVLDQYDVEST